MITLHNVTAVVPSNIDDDLEYRIECRAEILKDLLLDDTVHSFSTRLDPAERYRLDELIDYFTYRIAEKEIKETRYDY